MDSLICPICMLGFETTKHIPMVLYCGHTLCLECIYSMERRMGALNCPMCRGREYREASLIKKNMVIFQALEESKPEPMAPCSEHPDQESYYYCLNENLPFCTRCATKHKNHDFYDIEDEFITQGTDKQLRFAQEKIQTELDSIISERNTCLELHQQMENKRTRAKANIELQFRKIEKKLQKKKEEFFQLVNSPINNLVKRIRDTVDLLDENISKKQKIMKDIDNISREALKLAGIHRVKLVNELEHIDDSSAVVDIKSLHSDCAALEINDSVRGESVISAVRSLDLQIKAEKELEFEWTPPDINAQRHKIYSKMSLLVDKILHENIHMSPTVQEILRTTDRKDFMPDECEPYDDSPQKIGFNTTISAPHMHGITLNYLEQHLHPGKKVLDVGCGSGYFTVCMAKLIGQGQVFGVDHIEELINQAIDNIQANHAYLLNDPNIQLRMIHRDGRLGLEEFAPFDVINVGAATSEVPTALIQQLAVGGVLLAPVGPQSAHQRLTVYKKDEKGNITTRSGMAVNYMPLTDRDKQCPR